ncbi:MAG: carbohydrate ABC transporter permease [Firmicutes bacterium]|nr:carbohydrate ABC transporter permease [Bacillota bacterium]
MKKTLYHTALYMGLAVLAMVFLLPVLWMVATSLKNPVDDTSLALPSKPVWGNYAEAWRTGGFSAAFFNTMFIGIGAVVISILAGLPMAYSFARYRVRGRGALSGSLFALRILPEMVFLLPLYAMYRKLGLFDTKIGMILAFQIITLPYCVWLLRSFILQVPVDLEEAARVDGCSEWLVLWRVTLPVIAPGVVASSVLSFIAVWTSLLFPLALSYSQSQTVSVTIANFKGYGTFNWPIMAAASVIATIPQILFFGLINRYLVAGLTMGGVKE